MKRISASNLDWKVLAVFPIDPSGSLPSGLSKRLELRDLSQMQSGTGKTSANSYNGSTVTLGEAGASGDNATGGTGGGVSNCVPQDDTPNTGGGGNWHKWCWCRS